jgi:hypothetical protein
MISIFHELLSSPHKVLQAHNRAESNCGEEDEPPVFSPGLSMDTIIRHLWSADSRIRKAPRHELVTGDHEKEKPHLNFMAQLRMLGRIAALFQAVGTPFPRVRVLHHKTSPAQTWGFQRAMTPSK